MDFIRISEGYLRVMELTVERIWKKEGYTIGKLFINGEMFSNTMEDKDRGLNQDMPLREIKQIKMASLTAIPTGTYEVKMSVSDKFKNRSWGKVFGGKVPEICGVPGFSGVRIHPMNTAEDSLGCIGLGKNDKVGWISNSTDYYTRFVKQYLLPALEKNEKVYITIK